MTLAIVASLCGESVAAEAAERMEYQWRCDPST
jgi:hypothetical protein